MGTSYRRIDPGNMTPQERLNRIVELLAAASVRLAEDEMGLKPTEPVSDLKPDSVLQAESA